MSQFGTDITRYYDGRRPVVGKRAWVTVANGATGELVAAVSGKKICVTGLFGYGTALSVTLKSATTAISGALAGTTVLAGYNPMGWWVTVAGEALNVTAGASGGGNVHVTYAEVD